MNTNITTDNDDSKIDKDPSFNNDSQIDKNTHARQRVVSIHELLE